jgi:hypothetical protein
MTSLLFNLRLAASGAKRPVVGMSARAPNGQATPAGRGLKTVKGIAWEAVDGVLEHGAAN